MAHVRDDGSHAGQECIGVRLYGFPAGVGGGSGNYILARKGTTSPVFVVHSCDFGVSKEFTPDAYDILAAPR